MKQILSTNSRFPRLVPLPLSNELGQGNDVPTSGDICQANSSAVPGLEWSPTEIFPRGPWQANSQGLRNRKRPGVGSISAKNTLGHGARCFSTQPWFPQIWDTNSCPACVPASHRKIPAGRGFVRCAAGAGTPVSGSVPEVRSLIIPLTERWRPGAWTFQRGHTRGTSNHLFQGEETPVV